MSRIALGLMRINNLSVDEVDRLITDALDNGITFFDLADIYGNGHCEELLGEVLLRHPEYREKMYIQSKVGICLNSPGYDLSKEYIINAVKASLNRIKCGYLDCLLLHRVDIFMDNKEVSAAIKYLIENHMIKDFGVSNFTESEIQYLQQELKVKIKYNQVQLGLGNTTMLDQTMYVNMPSSMVSKESDSLFFFLKKEKIIIQCWSPYQMNFFEGSIFDENRYPKMNEVLDHFSEKYHCSKCALATAFLLKLDPNLLVITGSCSINHILQSLEGEKINLSKSDWYTIYRETGHLLP